jgi:hypothetical protein
VAAQAHTHTHAHAASAEARIQRFMAPPFPADRS